MRPPESAQPGSARRRVVDELDTDEEIDLAIDNFESSIAQNHVIVPRRRRFQGDQASARRISLQARTPLDQLQTTGSTIEPSTESADGSPSAAVGGSSSQDRRDPLSSRLIPAATMLRRTGHVTTSRPRPNTVHKPPDEFGCAQQLKLEMIGCDGGSFDNDDGGMYTAENVLRNDTSVYCTSKVENVNIALRAAGGKPFTLSRIVIKAPQRSFTSPVLDGLVFVSLNRIDSSRTDVWDRIDGSRTNVWDGVGQPPEPDDDAAMQESASASNSLSDDVDRNSLSSEGSVSSEQPPRPTRARDTTDNAPTTDDGARTTTQGLVVEDVPGSPATESLAPNAYFKVDEQLGIAQICFDPPVAGRYVHVKLLRGQRRERRQSLPRSSQDQRHEALRPTPPSFPRLVDGDLVRYTRAIQRDTRSLFALGGVDLPRPGSGSTTSSGAHPLPSSRERYYDRNNIDVQAILFYGWGRRVFPQFKLR